MSFDDSLGEMHVDMFELFGQQATVTRDGAAAVPVTVVDDKETRGVGEYGEAVALVSVLRFRTSEWRPQAGDVVTIGDQSRRVARIDAEDKFVTVAVMHG